MLDIRFHCHTPQWNFGWALPSKCKMQSFWNFQSSTAQAAISSILFTDSFINSHKVSIFQTSKSSSKIESLTNSSQRVWCLPRQIKSFILLPGPAAWWGVWEYIRSKFFGILITKNFAILLAASAMEPIRRIASVCECSLPYHKCSNWQVKRATHPRRSRRDIINSKARIRLKYRRTQLQVDFEHKFSFCSGDAKSRETG